MKIAVITGSAGLIGAESARFFTDKGFQVVGIDNDMRKYFFGAEASTDWSRKQLEKTLPNYRHVAIDIRDSQAVNDLFSEMGKDVKVLDSGKIVAESLRDYLERHPEIENNLTKNKKRIFFTTDSIERFNSLGSNFFGEKIDAKNTSLN